MKDYQYKLILNDKFISVIKNIKSSITDKLLLLNNNSDYGFSLSYINITDDDKISFTPSDKIHKDEFKYNNNKWTKNRNTKKIGRFINQVIDVNTKELELFVNSYKAEIKQINNLDNFKIIKGKDISKYYNHSQYIDGGGSMNKSCMRHDKCNDYFEFYDNNPDKVNMVILYDNNNKSKIIGRALLWYIDEPNITILDRIYTTNDYDINLFIKYAIKNKWYYKKTQTHSENDFTTPENDNITITCKIYLNDSKYDFFPYLDTLYYYDKTNSYLTNDIEEYKNNKNTIKLRSIDGGDKGNEHFIFDKFNNNIIKTIDSEYCNTLDYRIFKKDIIKVGDDRHSPLSIRYSEYDNKLYNKDIVTWSVYHNSFIYTNDVFKVYIDNNNYDYIHSDLKGEYFDYVYNKEKYYLKSLLIKGVDNKYHLKSEYDEKTLKEKELINKRQFKDKVKELNSFFDDFIKVKIVKNDYKNKTYGVFNRFE